MAFMRAVLLKEPGDLRVESVADPSPEADEIVLRVRNCGICGSDLHAAKYGLQMPPDAILGHEFAGEIVALGSRVAGWNVGERVVSLPYMSCGECPACRRGDGILCPALRGIGLRQLPGAFAEYVRVHPGSLLRIPPEIDFRTAAMVEPLAVGLHGLRHSGLGPERNCLILGAGPVGLVSLLWARDVGVQDVVVSELAAGRRAMAERLGGIAVDPTSGDPAAVVRERTGREPEVIVECIGARGVLSNAMMLAGIRGRIVVLGVCVEPDEILPITGILKELEVKFALGYSKQEFADALEALRSGRIDVGPLVTDVIDLERVPENFHALATPTTQCKVLIEFP
jgi:(R,R)-butanediol dehydrogenase/meso-butanediol dehydrogenase/diacetyl reductase